MLSYFGPCHLPSQRSRRTNPRPKQAWLCRDDRESRAPVAPSRMLNLKISCQESNQIVMLQEQSCVENISVIAVFERNELSSKCCVQCPLLKLNWNEQSNLLKDKEAQSTPQNQRAYLNSILNQPAFSWVLRPKKFEYWLSWSKQLLDWRGCLVVPQNVTKR